MTRTLITLTARTHRIVMFLDSAESVKESSTLVAEWKKITNVNFHNLFLPCMWSAYTLVVPMDSAELVALQLLGTGVNVHHL